MESSPDTAETPDPGMAREFDRLRAQSHARLFGARPQALPRIGRFELRRQLGKGGMGVVYAARDPQLDREVAIKVLTASSTDGDDAQRRWLREARALAKVNHPNVVQAYDVGTTTQGEVYIAMELVQGRSLRELGVQRGDDPNEVLEIYLQAARGLAAAHAVGVVHRDFKPDNVVLASDGRPRVVDFGLARSEGDPTTVIDSGERSASSVGDRITQTGTVLGTPAYMAPEQRSGEAVDARADQYSLCVALHEALYGRRPGDAAEATGSGRHDLVARVVRRGLASAADDRWPSMDALIEALRETQARPRRRRRLAVGLAAGATVAGLLWAAARRPDPACAKGPAVIDAAWNPARAQQLRTHLGETLPDVAETSFFRAQRVLDTYAAAWKQQHASTCTTGEQDAERFAVLQCLEARGHLLDANVSTMLDADASQLLMLDQALRVPSAQDCAQPERRRHTVALPEDPQQQRTVQSLRLAIAHADLQRRMGDPKGALDSLRALQAEVETTAFLPLQAEWNRYLAGALIGTGDYDQGQQAAKTTLALAKRADAPLSEAMGWFFVAFVEGYVGRDEKAGLHAIAMAEAAAASVGGDPATDVLLAGTRGQIELGAGRYDSALGNFGRALDLERQRPAPSIRMIGQLLDLQNIALQRMGQLERAEAKLDQAYTLLHEHVGPRHPRTVAAIMSRGNLALRRHDLHAAIGHYEHARSLLGDTKFELRAPLLNNLAQAYEDVGRLDDARDTLRAAVELHTATNSEDFELARALSNLGKIVRKLGDVPQGLALGDRAVAIGERIAGTTHPDLGHVLLNRAMTREASNDRQGALADARRARDVTRKPVPHAPHDLAVAMVERLEATAAAGDPPPDPH